MKAYIVKYALSKGIFETDDAEYAEYEGFIRVNDSLYSKNEWASTVQGAREKADNMKKEKINSFKRRIEKLERMDFITIKDISKLAK